MIPTRLLALPLPHLLVSWHKQCKGTRATSRWWRMYPPGGYIPPLDAKPLDAESRVMHVRLQFPSRSLGLMIHEALLFPSHIFYPLGTLCTGRGFGVHMPPRGQHPRVTGASPGSGSPEPSPGHSIPHSGLQLLETGLTVGQRPHGHVSPVTSPH